MRFRAWLLGAIQIALFTPLPTTLAIEDDLDRISNLVSDTAVLPVSKHFLRVGCGITNGINTTAALDVNNKENLRWLRVNVPEAIKDTAVKTITWFQIPKIFRKKGQNHQATSKFKTKIQNFLFSIAYWSGHRTEDIVVKAMKQTDPVKKTRYSELAEQFSAWVKKNHPE